MSRITKFFAAVLMQCALCQAAGALIVSTQVMVSVSPDWELGVADVTVDYSAIITNSDPALANAVVNFFVDWGPHDCLEVNNLDRSFCCANLGNSIIGHIRSRNQACPIGALASTFGYSAGSFDSDHSPCVYSCVNSDNSGGRSPLMLSLGDQRLRLTDLAHGVRFDLGGDGFAERVSWTSPGALDGFLALDRNGNGVIDSGAELFGDMTSQPPNEERNGFRALALFDEGENGGNDDGVVSGTDAAFDSLLVWFDLDHDGISRESELKSLQELGVKEIDLAYSETSRRDKHGNEFRYHSQVRLGKKGRRPIWDVYLLREEWTDQSVSCEPRYR